MYSAKAKPAIMTSCAKEPVEELVDKVAFKIMERLEEHKRHSSRRMTVGELFAYYMDNYAKAHCISWRDMERCFISYFGIWKERDISEIRRFEVQEWHTELGRNIGHTTANHAVELLCMIYNKAIEWEFTEKNPATKIRKFILTPRERFLQEDELSRFFSALNSLRYETTRDFLLMCLLTATRRSNVAAMRWDEISFERQIWHVPRTKNGTSEIKPLISEALAILARRKKRSNSEWVFPSTRSATGHLTKPEAAWAEVVKRASLTNLRIHDLRRTLASYQALTGVDVLAIAKTLNHKDLKSTLIYARLNVEGVRTAIGTAKNKILESAGIELEKIESENEAPAGLALLVPTITSEWVDAVEAAEILGVNPGLLGQWRLFNTGPEYSKSGYSIKYHTRSLLAWIQAHGTEPYKVKYPKRSATTAEIVKEIRIMSENGISFDAIAKSLNKQGLLNRGRPWRKSAVWNLYSKSK